MEKRRDHQRTRSSKTLPSSPSHSFSSSSSSDFEFTISISPRTNSLTGAGGLCPADELFYKGQLLPLHLSPRISMVRTLLLASSSTSSSSTATASRDSTASTSSSDQYSLPSSGRPSSAAEADHEVADLLRGPAPSKKHLPVKYFSLARFSSVFKKNKEAGAGDSGSSPVKRASSSAREVIRKYFKKVKPLYEKLSSQQTKLRSFNKKSPAAASSDSVSDHHKANTKASRVSHSFSGNLRYPMARRKAGGHVSSCPSSMRSSPSHSGLLSRNIVNYSTTSSGGGIVRANSGGAAASGSGYSGGETASSMEELQSAIQGAIAHCKNSMLQKQIIDDHPIN